MDTHLVDILTTLSDEDKRPYVSEIWVNGHRTQELVETLVRRALVPEERICFEHRRWIACVHRDKKAYPTAMIAISPKPGCDYIDVEAAVFDHLPKPFVIRTDYPLFTDLLQGGARRKRKRPSLRVVENSPLFWGGHPKDTQQAASIKTKGKRTETAICSPIGTNVLYPGEEECSSLRGTHDQDFLMAQQEDPALQNTWKQATPWTDEDQVPTLSLPTFFICNNRLYRAEKQEGRVIMQLLAPKPFQKQVLQLAHGSVVSGHLGPEKRKIVILN